MSESRGMSPPVSSPHGYEHEQAFLHDHEEPNGRPAKRVKGNRRPSLPADNHVEIVRKHPLGVRPSGNALTSKFNLKDSCGRFALLPDELLMHFLESLNVPHLLRLGSTCKALHAFTRNEELWRALFVESSPSSFFWRGTWRSTYLSQSVKQEPRVNCSNLFSDVLHRPFHCAHVSLEQYTSGIPSWNEIIRLKDLTSEEFTANWADKPFILTGPVKQWPLYQSWSLDHLLATYADVKFRAESVDWPLKTYAEYMNHNSDESPLYLFDRAFVEKMRLAVSESDGDYWPPRCFGNDFFSVLGDQRPDHRWLIVGPERSGSTFHKDPNATSAWNAVIRGSKYWIAFPSSASLPPPPGVYISADNSEITSPLSIAEWLLSFHSQARSTPGCKEGICHAGEVLHIPSGYYHLVLNTSPSIALTQNFVPRAHIGKVLRFLRNERQNVSGFAEGVREKGFELFVEGLREREPEALEEGLRELETATAESRWEGLRRVESGEGVFGFGFGAGDDDDEVE